MFLTFQSMLNGNHFMRAVLLTRIRDSEEIIHITFPARYRTIKHFTIQEKRIFNRKSPFMVIRLYGNHWLVLRGFYKGYMPKTCRNLRDVTTDMKNMDEFVFQVLTNHSQYISPSKRETLWKRYNILHRTIKKYLKKVT